MYAVIQPCYRHDSTYYHRLDKTTVRVVHYCCCSTFECPSAFKPNVFDFAFFLYHPTLNNKSVDMPKDGQVMGTHRGRGNGRRVPIVETLRDLQTAYYSCKGPNATYVKLISSDQHEFFVKREYALMSGTIRALLSGPEQFAENETNEIRFRGIPSYILELLCKYFAYKADFTKSSTGVSAFPIPPQYALELLLAANFLDC